MIKKSGKKKGKEKQSFFNSILEIFGWLRIIASPFLISVVIAVIIYVSNPNDTRLIIAIIVSAIGLIVGIIWAIRVSKKESPLDYVSKTSRSADFDSWDKDDEEEK